MMSHPVTQFQILSRDPEAAARFYTAVFGWSINADNPLGYREIEAAGEGGIGGGIWPCPPEARGFVQLFIEVDDANATLELVSAEGGRIVMPPQTLPDGTTMAIAHDAEGIPFGIVERR